MEKISSIVPRSRRVTSTDVAAASAVRPGAPSYGRPIGSSTAGPKDLMTTAQRAIAEQQRMQEARKQSALTPELVENMTNRFFLQKISPDAQGTIVGLQPALPQIETGPVVAAPVSVGEAQVVEVDGPEEEYVPLGSYIDVKA